MSLMDYLKGPGYKSEAERLSAALKTSQDEYAALLDHYSKLDALAKEVRGAGCRSHQKLGLS